MFVVPQDGRNISPTIYFTDETAEQIADKIEAGMSSTPTKIDTEKWFTREYFTKHLQARIISNTAVNLDGLEKNGICYRESEKLGLVVTAYITLDNMEGASIQIRKDMLDKVGMNEIDVIAMAIGNLKDDFQIKSMLEIMREMIPVEDDIFEDIWGAEDTGMYVLTNNSRMFGASQLLCDKALEELGKRIGSYHFYILPSSIHELIALEKTKDMDPSELLKMVKEVNGTQVEETDRLCDGVFEVDLEEDSPRINRIA